MESRKTKKQRSFGEPAKDSRVLRSPALDSRPDAQERTHSAPHGINFLQEQTDNDPVKKTSHQSIISSLKPSAVAPSETARPASPNKPREQKLLAGATSKSSGQGKSLQPIRELNFATLGTRGCGKSTFIRCALDLKKPAVYATSSKKVSLEGEIFHVSLIEVKLEDLKFSKNNEILWPKSIGKRSLPRIDGILALYDVVDRDSIAAFPRLLSACSEMCMPCVIVSCKCDNPQPWPIDPRKDELLKNTTHTTERFQTSRDTPHIHKRCISVILKSAIIEQKRYQSFTSATRPRALTISTSSEIIHSSTPFHKEVKHSRATSELSASAPWRTPSKPLIEDSLTPESSITFNDNRPVMDYTTPYDNIGILRYSPPAPLRDTGGLSEPLLGSPPDDSSSQQISKNRQQLPIVSATNSPTMLPMSAFDAGFSIDRDANLLQEESIFAATNSLSKDSKNREVSSAETGLSFEQLIDRLLSLTMSKADVKFTAVFLCLYRKFATPSELLSAIIYRWETVKNNSGPKISCIGSQLRYLGILIQWLSDYPGDFAYPMTRHCMSQFIMRLDNARVFAVAAKELALQLDCVSDDDDTHWAYSDESKGTATTLKTLSRISTIWNDGVFGLNSLAVSQDSKGRDTECEIESRQRGVKHSKSPSSSSSTDRPTTSHSDSSLSTLPTSIDAARQQSQRLVPVLRYSLTKVQWHEFMEIPIEDIANELTRIDWIMFISIQPRDLFRHVSLQADQREVYRNLGNVDRMIHQFQHLAFWVANMILLRDKPKHRAQALEKFMSLAWKLRQMNNYNSLGAIIAGISGTAVYRLAQTRELVSQQVQKDFLRLEILMSAQRSHFAYRLAWENTTSERIPFLPIHRRDLVSAEEGNKTFVGDRNDRINWRKFEIMGENIISVRNSQRMPGPILDRNRNVQHLVLDCRFSKDDDELYERSIQVEKPRAGERRFKFNWFSR